MDDLRTRIAAVLRGVMVDDWYDYSEVLDVADAVIRKLGLRRDPIDPFVNQLLFGDANSRKHRYVTDWEITDE